MINVLIKINTADYVNILGANIKLLSMGDGDNLKVIVGKNVREARKQLNYTQSKLAEKIDIQNVEMSRIEKGLVFPKYETFEKLIIALKIRPYQLFKTDEDNIISVAEHNRMVQEIFIDDHKKEIKDKDVQYNLKHH